MRESAPADHARLTLLLLVPHSFFVRAIQQDTEEDEADESDRNHQQASDSFARGQAVVVSGNGATTASTVAPTSTAADACCSSTVAIQSATRSRDQS